MAMVSSLLFFPYLTSIFLGYGARYPTSRNTMTLPANVPLHRMPPDTERFLQGCRSTQRVKLDDRAMKRQADTLALLTSGEIGYHTLGRQPDSVRINMKKVEEFPPKPKDYMPSYIPPTTHSNKNLAETDSYGGNLSGRGSYASGTIPVSQRSGFSSSYRNGEEFAAETTHPNQKYLSTLQHLDSSFGRNAKRDLLAASLPAKPQQELVLVATTIQHSALQSKAWQLKLRRDNQ